MTNEEIIAGLEIKYLTSDKSLQDMIFEAMNESRADERNKLKKWLNENEAVDSFILPDDMKKYILQTSKK